MKMRKLIDFVWVKQRAQGNTSQSLSVKGETQTNLQFGWSAALQFLFQIIFVCILFCKIYLFYYE